MARIQTRTVRTRHRAPPRRLQYTPGGEVRRQRKPRPTGQEALLKSQQEHEARQQRRAGQVELTKTLIQRGQRAPKLEEAILGDEKKKPYVRRGERISRELIRDVRVPGKDKYITRAESAQIGQARRARRVAGRRAAGRGGEIAYQAREGEPRVDQKFMHGGRYYGYAGEEGVPTAEVGRQYGRTLETTLGMGQTERIRGAKGLLSRLEAQRAAITPYAGPATPAAKPAPAAPAPTAAPTPAAPGAAAAPTPTPPRPAAGGGPIRDAASGITFYPDPGGGHYSVKTATLTTDTGAVNVPTVLPGGQVVDARTALDHWKQNDPTQIDQFPSVEAAVQAAQAKHLQHQAILQRNTGQPAAGTDQIIDPRTRQVLSTGPAMGPSPPAVPLTPAPAPVVQPTVAAPTPAPPAQPVAPQPPSPTPLPLHPGPPGQPVPLPLHSGPTPTPTPLAAPPAPGMRQGAPVWDYEAQQYVTPPPQVDIYQQTLDAQRAQQQQAAAYQQQLDDIVSRERAAQGRTWANTRLEGLDPRIQQAQRELGTEQARMGQIPQIAAAKAARRYPVLPPKVGGAQPPTAPVTPVPIDVAGMGITGRQLPRPGTGGFGPMVQMPPTPQERVITRGLEAEEPGRRTAKERSVLANIQMPESYIGSGFPSMDGVQRNAVSARASAVTVRDRIANPPAGMDRAKVITIYKSQPWYQYLRGSIEQLRKIRTSYGRALSRLMSDEAAILDDAIAAYEELYQAVGGTAPAPGR